MLTVKHQLLTSISLYLKPLSLSPISFFSPLSLSIYLFLCFLTVSLSVSVSLLLSLWISFFIFLYLLTYIFLCLSLCLSGCFSLSVSFVSLSPVYFFACNKTLKISLSILFHKSNSQSLSDNLLTSSSDIRLFK